MFAVWSPLVCRGPIYPWWACASSPLATQPGRESMHARKQSTAKHLLCNRVGSSPAERGSPCVFSAYCSRLLFHASPPSSCFAWGRKTLWKFLAASPFFSLSLLLPPLLVAIKNIMNLSQHFNPVFPPRPAPCLMFLFYPSQHCVTDPIQSNVVYRMLVGSLQRSSFKWQAPAQPAAQRWSLGDACCLHAGP